MGPLRPGERLVTMVEPEVQRREGDRRDVVLPVPGFELREDGLRLRPPPRAREHIPERRLGIGAGAGKRHALTDHSLRFDPMALLRQHETQRAIALFRGGIDGDGAGEVVARLVVAARVVVDPADGAPDGDRGGIELERGVALDQRLVESPVRRQPEGVPLVRRGVGGIQLDGPLKFSPGGFPVPIVDEQAPGERGVGLGEGVVELESLPRVGFRPRKPFGDRDAAIVQLKRVRIGEPGVGRRVAAVLLDGLLEISDRLSDSLLGALVPGVTAFEVEPVGLEVLGVALGSGLGKIGEGSRPQGGHDGAGDLLLNGKDVRKGPIVARGPEQAAVVGGAQLGRDAQPVTRATHGAFEDPGGAQQGADRSGILGLALEREDGGTGGHAETLDLGERVDELVGDPVAQVVVFRVRTRIDQRQHRDAAADARGVDAPVRIGAFSLHGRNELRRGGVAFQRVLGQRPGQRLLDPGRQLRPEDPHRPGEFGDLFGEGDARSDAAQGRLAGQHLIQNTGQAVEITGGGKLTLPGGLLGTHVLRGTERNPHPGHHARSDGAAGACNTEVGEHRVAVGEEDVLGLHVAVQEAFAVGVVERGANLAGDPDRVGERKAPRGGQPLAQRAVGYVRRHVVEEAGALTGVDQRQNVRMDQAGGDADFPQEALGSQRGGNLGREHLDGDLAAMALVERQIDRGHTAATELTLDGIAIGEGGPEEVRGRHLEIIAGIRESGAGVGVRAPASGRPRPSG